MVFPSETPFNRRCSRYWGLNPVEFVLKAMNGSKLHDAMRVAQCFREREESHLVLVYKTPPLGLTRRFTSFKEQALCSCRSYVYDTFMLHLRIV